MNRLTLEQGIGSASQAVLQTRAVMDSASILRQAKKPQTPLLVLRLTALQQRSGNPWDPSVHWECLVTFPGNLASGTPSLLRHISSALIALFSPDCS